MSILEAPTLFDAPLEGPAPVRTSDPETSHHAAATLNMRERKREVIRAFTRLGRAATASEITREMRRDAVIREVGSVRSRLAQLRHDGRTRKTGGVRTIPTDDGGTGRPEQLWELIS